MISSHLNPFRFDAVASDENFCNRREEIKELLGEIRASHNVVVFSQRRYGKTSLILEVLKSAKNEGYLTIYADIFHIIDENNLVRAYAKAVASSLAGPLEKAIQTLKTIFSSLRPKITLNADGNPEFTFGLESHRSPGADLEEVLESVNAYVIKNKLKAVVVFDEFQQIGQLEQAHRIEGIIRSHIQQHKRISYIFMGSKKHLILNLFSDPSRPLYGIGKMFPLDKISSVHLSEFIFGLFQKTDKPISKKLASRIVKLCELHPYYTQYTCHSLWEMTSFHSAISEQDIEAALNVTLKRTSPRYEGVWELLPLGQKQALIVLANISEDEKLFSNGVIKKFNLSSAPAFRKALRGLFDKGIVDIEKDKYLIIDIFFKKWIKANFLLD